MSDHPLVFVVLQSHNRKMSSWKQSRKMLELARLVAAPAVRVFAVFRPGFEVQANALDLVLNFGSHHSSFKTTTNTEIPSILLATQRQHLRPSRLMSRSDL